MDRRVGDLVADRYELRIQLDNRVFVAHDRSCSRDVVVKFPRPSRDVAHEAGVQRAMVGVGAAVPVLDIGPDYFTMELVRGRTLWEALQDEQLDRDHLLGVFARVCDAIARVHASGHTHSSFGDRQVLLADTGEVYVIDWESADRFPQRHDLEHLKFTLQVIVAAVVARGLSAAEFGTWLTTKAG